MNLTQLYLDTFIPEYPKIINSNFASISRYVDMFYDEGLGILTKPLTTTGRVKGARGEFVTVVVDNLIVKNQFTNLFDNNTTADYNFYKLYIDPAVTPRDPCTAVDFWPQELSGYKYIDVNKPYYKIQNIAQPYVFSNNNLSQVVGIFLDPSLVSLTETFKVILDPHYPYQYFIADASAVGDPSAGTGFYVEFIATSYDPSYGTTWAQYKHGLPVVGSGSGGGGSVGPGTPNYIPMFGLPTTITDSPLSISGTTLYTDAINVNGLITLSNFRVTGVASPLVGTDAVNRNYADQFSTNASVNTALGQFVRSASTGNGLYWVGGILDVSLSTTGADIAYVDGSLAARDASITQLFNIKVNNASMGLYYTKTQIDASFAKYSTTIQMNAALGLRDTSIAWLDANKANNASLGLYATNASVGLALGFYATNASVNAAGFAKQTYVDGSLAARDASITWLYNNTLTVTALNPYATNASVGLALGFYATNASVNAAGFATNASVNAAGFITNSSVNIALAQFIRSASNGYGLVWNGGLLDVSIVGGSGPSFAYVDGSLAARDVSIAWLNLWKLAKTDADLYYVQLTNLPAILGPFATNASVNFAFTNYYDISTIDYLLSGYITQAYVDGSLYDMQLQIFSLDSRVTVLENSTGNATFAYVDGSLFTRDSSIILLFQRLGITDTSLTTLTTRHNITEASLGALTLASLNFATNASIGIADFAKNSSMNFVYKWQVSQDVSIVDLRGINNTQTAQINSLNTRMTGAEASINRLDASVIWLCQQTYGEVTKVYVDGSLAARDYQIDLIWANMVDFPYVDGSLNNIRATYIKSSSTGIGLYWNAGYLDVSIAAGVSKEYIDGSIAALNASVNLALGAYATNASVNLALGAYATNASINAAGFATNASIGTFKSTYIDPSISSKFNTAGGLITGGVQIGTIGTPVDVCIYNSLYVSGHTHVGGNLTVDGSLIYTNVASLDVSTVYIKLNTGQVGIPNPGLQSGIIVTRGSYDPYIFVFDQNTETFRVGISFQETSTHYNDASTQAVATREDSPLSDGIAYWNSARNRFDTSLGFTKDSFLSWQLSQDASINILRAKDASIDASLGLYATNASIATAAFAKNASLGPLYAGVADVSYWAVTGNNFSIATQVLTINTRGGSTFTAQFSNTYLKEVSIGSGLIWNAGYLDVSVAGGGVSKLYVDGSLATRDAKIAQHDASIIRIDASLNDAIDVSIILGSYATNASINAAGFATNASIASAGFAKNASLNLYATNASVGLALSAAINGSTNTIPAFNSIGSLKNSYFKQNGSNEFTVANDTGNMVISSGITQGDLILKTANNGFADFKLDPRNGVITLGLSHTNTNVYLNAGGTQTNINFNIQPAGNGETKLYGGLRLPSIANSSTNKVLYYDSSTYLVTWANVASGVTSLSALSDVSIVSIADNNLLKYDSASGKWRNVSGLDASSYFQLKIAKNTVPGTGSTGNAGDWSYDASYLYLCTSTNKWGRISLDYAF